MYRFSMCFCVEEGEARGLSDCPKWNVAAAMDILGLTLVDVGKSRLGIMGGFCKSLP